MMTLADTIKWMNSDDYKERFIAEYWQTKIRYDKLHKALVKHEAGTLPYTFSCPVDVLRGQIYLMGEYLTQLEIRAEIEGIDLESVGMRSPTSCFNCKHSVWADTATE